MAPDCPLVCLTTLSTAWPRPTVGTRRPSAQWTRVWRWRCGRRCGRMRPPSHTAVWGPGPAASARAPSSAAAPARPRPSYAAPAASYSKVKFVLFNDATGTHWFLSYHRLLDVIHMVTLTHFFLEGNPLPPHRLLFSISSKGSFICTFP